MDIDAVEEGTADLAEIVLDLARGATALAGGIAVEAAFTPVRVTTALEDERGVPARTKPAAIPPDNPRCKYARSIPGPGPA